MTQSHVIGVTLAGVLLGGTLGYVLETRGPVDPNPELERATVLFGQHTPVPPFELIDHRAQVFDESNLKSRWSLLFFGYTHCPDICPTTLSTVKGAIEVLNTPALDDLQVIFVSVDPERDSSSKLGRYITFFDPAFIGVTGEHERLERFTAALGAVYRIEQHNTEETNYAVDHSSRLLLINPAGQLHAVFAPPHESGVLAHELTIIAEAFGSA
ncbi:MAG: SCO family protein [Gammaproteobacteria bacterium]|nr:SCO family protein [Gammaproteobacteria bacterium]